ncbi:beta-ketoacyl synthase N-terminal-like domain-containing protein [Streptomyces boninensis]|uniref:beta-ketoacyl synthase N-terminal-like domain-containing protein n=1 Tax=Streptomyces boninensis TaxID=2039455 RepID=UPI003B21F3CB
MLVISGWAVTSPYGLGREPFAAGLRSGGSALSPLDGGVAGAGYESAGLIPGFDARTVLGRKGTRSMDRATAIAAATVGLLLDEYGAGLDAAPEETGLVLGTSGSVQSIMDFTESALTGDKPYLVDPARFPNTVMNCPAGQSAIRHTLKGPNVTVSGGAVTGLLAVNYGSRLLRAGRARALAVGAVEEFSEQRARLEWAADHGGELPWPPAEGAALFLLEEEADARAAGRDPIAEVIGSRFRAFTDPARAGEALEACVADVLNAAGSWAEHIACVAPSCPPGRLGKQELQALEGLGAPRVEVRPLIGDATAAAAAFQLAAVLAGAAADPSAAGRPALVTAVDRDGTVGATLLRPL